MTSEICGTPSAESLRLVIKDPAEIEAVGKDFRLAGKEDSPGIHEVHARKLVVERDLLRADMFFYRLFHVRSPLDCGIVGNDHGFAAVNHPDAGDDPGRRKSVAVLAESRQSRKLEEGRAGIDQQVDPFPGQQFAPGFVLLPCFFRTSLTNGFLVLLEFVKFC